MSRLKPRSTRIVYEKGLFQLRDLTFEIRVQIRWRLRFVVEAQDFFGICGSRLELGKHSPGAMENKSGNEGGDDDEQD